MRQKLFVLAFLTVWSLPLLGRAQVTTLTRLQGLNETITINADKSLNVKDVVTFDFGAGSYPYAGRSFVVQFNNSTSSYEVSDIVVADAAGQPVKFTADTEQGFENIVIGDGLKQPTGRQTFAITYKVRGAFVLADDGSGSFYWDADSASSQGADQNFSVTVTDPLLPAGWSLSPNCDVSTADLSGTANCDHSRVQGDTATFEQAEVPASGYFNVGVNFAPPQAATGQLPADGEQIQNFAASYRIQSDGGINVQEKIVYDFGGNQKHGIYRDIPVATNTWYGQSVTPLSNVSVTDEQGTVYPFTVIGGGTAEIRIGDPAKLVGGVKTYIISYRIARAVNFYQNFDELYWNVTGDAWTVPMQNVSVAVILPGQPAANPVTLKCYTGLYGSDRSCDDFKSKAGGATFTQNKLEPGQGLTVLVDFPKGLVAQPTFSQKLAVILRDNWILLLPLLVLVLMFYWWLTKERIPAVHETIIAQYEVPDNLSPAAVAQLWKVGTQRGQVIAAEIIQLAVLGFLKINEQGGNYTFSKLKQADNSLNAYQQKLFNAIFYKSSGDTSEETDLLNLNHNAVFYGNILMFFRMTTGFLVNSGYERKGWTKVRTWTFLAGFLAIFLGIVLAVIMVSAAWLYGLALSGIIVIFFGVISSVRTVLGLRTLDKIKGLRLYLNVAEKDRLNFADAPGKTPAHFEKLLAYAIALGVEKEWAGQFVGIYSASPSWYHGNIARMDALALANSMHGLGSRTGAAYHSSAPHGSGHGGGRGFSGGGGGGGGGGSW